MLLVSSLDTQTADATKGELTLAGEKILSPLRLRCCGRRETGTALSVLDCSNHCSTLGCVGDTPSPLNSTAFCPDLTSQLRTTASLPAVCSTLEPLPSVCKHVTPAWTLFKIPFGVSCRVRGSMIRSESSDEMAARWLFVGTIW